MISDQLTITASTPAEDIPQEVKDEALNISDGWYRDTRIDWDDVLDRLDGMNLPDGRTLEIAVLHGPAIAVIKKYVNDARRS